MVPPNAALVAFISFSTPAADAEAEEESPRLRLSEYLDEFCIDVPEGSCDALYALADAIERIVVRGAVDAGTWCCRSCGAGRLKDAKITCDGCTGIGKSKSWRCGDGIRFADRPHELDCPGATHQFGETVSCF